MPLMRGSGQPSKTLQCFYEECAASTNLQIRGSGEAMLRLLPLLEMLCEGRDVWALTSHTSLMLMPEDDHRSSRVSVAAYRDSYTVRYDMPEDEAPWPRARVEGHATEPDGACRLIEVAIERCRAW